MYTSEARDYFAKILPYEKWYPYPEEPLKDAIYLRIIEFIESNQMAYAGCGEENRLLRQKTMGDEKLIGIDLNFSQEPHGYKIEIFFVNPYGSMLLKSCIMIRL